MAILESDDVRRRAIGAANLEDFPRPIRHADRMAVDQ